MCIFVYFHFVILLQNILFILQFSCIKNKYASIRKNTSPASFACHPIRREILEYFQKNKNALTHADLEVQFSTKFDRVLFTERLPPFLENGLLHKIPDDSELQNICLVPPRIDRDTHDDFLYILNVKMQ